MEGKEEIIIYQTEDGKNELVVHLQDETVWPTQRQMADLFERERSVITKHIKMYFRKMN
jgi:hypothetical protein